MSERAGQGTNRGTRTVAMLSILYALSGIDRMIISLLVTPIKAEFLVSDTQIGLLFGLSFALLYSLSGLPIARIADHGNRKWLVISGVMVWSLSTILSGFVWDYWSLTVCRAGVAVGEAVLTPAAISMIADLYPRERRGPPTAIYTATGNVFGLSAAAIGGLALAFATVLSPVFDDMAPWRLTMILVGLPGIALAIVFAILIREPSRQQSAPPSVDGRPHLMRHLAFYLPLFGAVGASVMVSYALIGWTPTLLQRDFGLEPATAGYVFGTIGVFAGGAGTLGTPFIAGWLARRTGRDGLLPVGLAMAVIALPAVVATMLSSTIGLFLAGLAIALAALPSLTILPSLIIQQVTPPQLRGQTVALYLLIANLAGLGCGPALAGLLSDHVFQGSGSMGRALLTLGVSSLTVTIILLLMCRAPYQRLIAESDAGNAARQS